MHKVSWSYWMLTIDWLMPILYVSSLTDVSIYSIHLFTSFFVIRYCALLCCWNMNFVRSVWCILCVAEIPVCKVLRTPSTTSCVTLWSTFFSDVFIYCIEKLWNIEAGCLYVQDFFIRNLRIKKCNFFMSFKNKRLLWETLCWTQRETGVWR